MERCKLEVKSQVLKCLLRWAVLTSLFAGPCGGIAATVSEDRKLRSMCDAGLSEVAVKYVRQRMLIEQDRDAVAWWVMREMECLAQIARRSAGDSTQLWLDCLVPADTYRQRYVTDDAVSDDARWPWIQWQAGRCDLLQSQSILAKFLANPTNFELRDAGLDLVRKTLEDIDDLLADLKRRQSLSARQGVSSGPQAPAEQLRNLAADALLLQCELLLVRSQFYAKGSADRAAALAEVQDKSQDLLKRTGDDWPVRPGLLLAVYTAQLESGDLSAINRLEQLAQQSGPVNVSALAAATAARASAQAGQFSRAATLQQQLLQLVRTDPTWVPLAKLVDIEVALEEVQQQTRSVDTTVRLNQLSQQAVELGDRYGDYWRTRAEALIIGGMSNSQLDDPQVAVELLMAQVRQLVAADQTAQAVDVLRQARDAQTAAGNGPLALELASTAAALLRHQNLWADSAEMLAGTAQQFSKEEQAATAHVWVLRARAEEIKAKPNDLALNSEYEKSLVNQIKQWPDHPATQPGRSWLRDWMVGPGRSEDYLRLLQELLAQTGQAGFRGGLLDDYLSQLMQTGYPKLRQIIEQSQKSRESNGDPMTAQAIEAVELAALTIAQGTAHSQWDDRASSQLRRQTMSDWLTSADQSQYACSDLVAAAVAILSIRLQQPESVISGYDMNRLSPHIRAALAPCLVELLDNVVPSSGDTAQRRQLMDGLGLKDDWLAFDHAALPPLAQSALARMKSWEGVTEAAARVEALAKEHPKQGAIQLIWSRSLADQGQLQQAQSIAKRVAALAPAGSSLQLAARWQLMQLQVQSGQRSQAQQAARLLLATQPNLSEFWSQRFIEASK